MGAYQTKLDARVYAQWPRERDPSTRESLRPMSKNFPVDLTLATPGTAEDLITVDAGQQTINMITNPSFALPGAGNPPTGMVASEATLDTDGTTFLYGATSMEVTPDNAADNEGGYWDLGSYPAKVPLCVSVYLRDAAAGGDEALVIIKDDSGNTIATGNTVTLSTSWQRSVAQIGKDEMIENTNLRAYVVTGSQHGTVFYADGLQAESLETASVYCDGEQGLDNEWLETANASPSRRYRHVTELRNGHLFFTRDTYIAFDRDADSSATDAEDRGEFVKAGTDYNFDRAVLITNKISIVNAVAGEQPRVYGNFWGC